MSIAFALRHWREGLIIAALLLAALLYVGKLRAERGKARAQAQVVALIAAVERQNAAVGRWREAARAAQARSAAALEAVRRQAPSVEQRARRAEAPRPLSGDCRTPREVTEAGL